MMTRFSVLQIGVALSIFCLAPLTASGQSRTDGSIYSRFGLGQRTAYHSPKSLALGGGGFALRSIDYANHANPASLSDQLFTRFAGGFSLQGITESAAQGEDSRLRSGAIEALQLSFPLVAGKFGLGLSFEPFSRVNYRVDTSGSVVVDPDAATAESYFTSFQGNGGLQKFSGSAGYAVLPTLHVGLRADVLFGHVDEIQTTDFLSADLRDGSLTSTTRLHGTAATLGLRYILRSIASEQDALSIGLVYTLPVTLTAERNHTSGEGEVTDTLGTSVRGKAKLPMMLATGLAYQPDARWTVVADVLYEKWSDFSSDLPFPGIEAGSSAALSDRIRLSAGVEFFPGAGRSFGSFLQRLALRLGVYTDKAYVSPDADHDITSFGFTGGMSLPGLIGGTSLDINLDVGRRGTTDYGLIRDRYVRFGINLNFGERWFDRAKLR